VFWELVGQVPAKLSHCLGSASG